MTRLGADAVDLDEIMAARAKMRAREGPTTPATSPELMLGEASLVHLIMLWLGLTALIVVKAIANVLEWLGRVLAQPEPKHRKRRR